jgi:hypothetical protein
MRSEKPILFKVLTKNRESLMAQALGKYTYTYNKGERMKADPNTLGFMLFRHISNAVNFKSGFSSSTIIKVRAHSEVTCPELISSNCNMLDLYYSFATISNALGGRPPDGTVCCHEITPLE